MQFAIRLDSVNNVTLGTFMIIILNSVKSVLTHVLTVPVNSIVISVQLRNIFLRFNISRDKKFILILRIIQFRLFWVFWDLEMFLRILMLLRLKRLESVLIYVQKSSSKNIRILFSYQGFVM